MIAGRGLPGVIVWLGPPGMSKTIACRSACALAIWIAARSVHWLPSVWASTSQMSSEGSRSASSPVVLTTIFVGTTSVSALEESLDETGSGSVRVTVAVLEILPIFVGTTTIVTVAWAPLPIEPRSQVTVLFACPQVPCEASTDTKLTVEGRGSVTWTPDAAEGPALETVSV